MEVFSCQNSVHTKIHVNRKDTQLGRLSTHYCTRGPRRPTVPVQEHMMCYYTLTVQSGCC